MARVRFAEIAAIAVLAASLAACGGNASAPTAAGTSVAQTESAASAASTTEPSAPAADTSSAPVTASSRASSAGSATTAPDTSKVLAEAWLPASRLPLIGKLAWQLDQYHSATSGVAVNAGMDEQAPYYPCQPAQLAHVGVKGIQSRDYHLDPAPSPDATQVQQIQLFFADAASAKTGLATIAGWYPTCTVGKTQTTASTTGGSALLLTGTDGSVVHEYFVQRGAVIDSVVITINGATASMKSTSQDKATLEAMASLLCAYKGAC